MTSEEDCEEILCKCNSRFFEGYITKVLFTVTDIVGGFMCVYDNKRQLDTVLKDLREIML